MLKRVWQDEFEAAVQAEVERRMMEFHRQQYFEERLDELQKRVFVLEDKLREKETPVCPTTCEPK